MSNITSPDAAIQASLDRISAYGPYGYQPSLVGNAIFCAVWGVCCIVLTYQSLRGRRWWMLATLAFGSLLECGGNAVRIYGHFHSDVVNPYIAQQVILVLTPAFFAAAHFTILVKVCQLFDPKYVAPFRPAWLIPFFVILDVASLAVQGGGSGMAAIAEINGQSVDTVNGHGQIVTAGLAIQLAGYVAFNAIFLLFVRRASKKAEEHNKLWNKETKMFLLVTWLSAILVLGRSCFRTAEMAMGWIGVVATTEWYYLVFDAAFVASAVILLIIFSPARYLPRAEDHFDDGAAFPRHSSDLETQTGAVGAAPIVGTPKSTGSTLAYGHQASEEKMNL